MSSRRLTSAAALVAVVTCVFWSTSASPHETVSTTVLFDREIVRILNSHCVMCHVDGGPSFPLTTYEEAWLARRKMSASVISRHMPPWAALPGYGSFRNANAVTLRESQFLVSWMEGLGPRNAGKVFTNTSDPSAPTPQPVGAHAEFGVWHLGQPDIVREIGARTVIDLGLTSERRVRAFEYLPGNRRAIRAATFTVQETGQWLGSWTPWYGFVDLPKSVAFLLPAGAHLVADIQYRQGSEAAADRGKVGLFFDSLPGSKLVSDLVVEATGATRAHGELRLAAGTTLLALCPDLGAGVTSLEVSARRPDGGTGVLLFAKDFQKEWPTPYIFAEPIALAAGTTLAVTAYGGNVRLTVSTVSSGPSPRTSTPPAPRSR